MGGIIDTLIGNTRLRINPIQYYIIECAQDQHLLN